jgi:hypothetical protein
VSINLGGLQPTKRKFSTRRQERQGKEAECLFIYDPLMKSSDTINPVPSGWKRH